MAPITADSGKSAGDAVEETLKAAREEISEDVIQYWFTQSQEWLEEAASNRADLDSEDRTGREENGLFAIQQYAVPPSWEDDHWEFAYPHEGAVFQEFGAKPHEIRARRAEVLAFEWPDAPKEVKEQFEYTEGDLVFFESIDHPGIPAIGFVRKGRDRTAAQLRGIRTETFESGGGR